MSMFTRFVNIRNALNINNFNVIGSVLNIIERPDIVCKSYSTADIKEINEITSDQTGKLLERKSSKAMKAYLEQSKAYKNFIEKQIAEYNIGKRHLANMMGEDPNNFTQQDIDNSIKYLFPSGLFEKEAVPIMKHPDQLYQSKKEAEFDDSGRPHHFLFYTIKPNYYESLYIIADSFNYLNKMEDKKLKMHIPSDPENKIDLTGSTWLDKAKIENMFLEKLTNLEYDYFIKSMEKLVEHPLSKHVSSVIMKYRVDIVSINKKIELPKFEYDSNNRPFILISDCLRKSTRGQVKVIGNGSGNITINGKDIRYFSDIQCREQVIFPLIFTNLSDKVDVEANIHGGGPTGQAGTVRYGISMALRSFVDEDMREKMKLAGLLTRDWRRRERKKWGQEGARRKFTWLKR